MSITSQLALQDDQEVAIGDDWSRSYRFTDAAGDGIDIVGEEFTAEILDKHDTNLVTLTQTISAHADDTGDVMSVLTVSTLDISLPVSPLHRWVLRTSTLADRGLVGGAFIVRPVGAVQRGRSASTAPTVVIGGGVTLTLNVGAVGPANDLGNVYLTDGDDFATASIRRSRWGVTADGDPYYDEDGVAAADRAFMQFNPETGAPVLIRIGA